MGEPSIGRHPWAVAALPDDPGMPGARSRLIAGGSLSSEELDRIAGSLGPGETIAVTAARRGPPPVGPVSAVLRAWRLVRSRLAAASVRARATRIARRLQRAGLETQRIDIGANGDGYAFSLGGEGVGVPVDSAIIANRGGAPRPRTLLERAVADAERIIGAPLEIQRGRVLASSTVMVEVSGTGRRFLLRLADPKREPAVTAAGGPLELLLAAGPPEAVRERTVSPIARGAVDALGWALEEHRPGSHPNRLTGALWTDCCEFLAALAATPRSGGVSPKLSEQTRALEPLLSPGERRSLGRVAAQADEGLASVPRRWGHGDFHPGNLLVERGELATVLDWDAASPHSLPGLDLIHLIATTDPSLRRLPHGQRALGPLRDRVAPAGDARLDPALHLAGIPGEPDVREALVDAYWLGRVVRDVVTFPGWAAHSAWLGPNLRHPLARVDAKRLR